MKIRGRGNGLAITLAGLALVFAASGTAYAVTATTVNIADPTTPSRIAKVDPSGRLSTVGATSTLNITTISFPNASHNGDLYSAPTAATLAVTSFGVVALGPLSGTWSVYLFKVPVLADGTCSTTTTTTTLGYGTVAPGAGGGHDFASPIVVAPSGTAKYCLDVFYRLLSGTASGSENFGVQITGYVASGRYTGAGAPEAAPGAARSKVEAAGGR